MIPSHAQGAGTLKNWTNYSHFRPRIPPWFPLLKTQTSSGTQGATVSQIFPMLSENSISVDLAVL